MTKFEKIYAAIVLVAMVLEMVVLAVISVVQIIRDGDWSSLILLAFIPMLAIVICVFYDILKNERGK